jgi:hypothetical protein
MPEKKRDELIAKLMQIEEHARAAIGEDARLANERMKFVASVAAYLRTSIGMYWRSDQAGAAEQP